MVITHRGSGHRPSRRPAHRIRCLRMFHPAAHAQHPVIVINHIARRIDIRVAGAQRLVDHDTVLHLQASLFRQRRVQLHPYSGHDYVGLSTPPAGCQQRQLCSYPFQANHRFTRQHLHAVLPVIIVQKLPQLSRKYSRPNRRLGKHQTHLPPLHRQRRRHLGAYKTAANHSEPLLLLRQPQQPLVIVQCPVIHNLLPTKRQPPRRPPRRQQQPPKAPLVPVIVRHQLALQVQRFNAVAQK